MKKKRVCNGIPDVLKVNTIFHKRLSSQRLHTEVQGRATYLKGALKSSVQI